MSVTEEIWILADNRPGTFFQSVGLAEELKMSYKIITISYNFFSALPNFLLQDSLVGITSNLRQEFSALTSFPKIIISAGRKTAPIALHLKKLSKNQSKIIQIMNPNFDFSKFDFVILPKHDGISQTKFPNLITTVGALTRVDEKRIEDDLKKFPQLQKINKTKIALLVGGASKKTDFSESDAKDLAQISSNITKNMNAILLVLTSRRTGEKLTKTITDNLNCDYEIFDWSKLEQNNPYLAILASSDFFIVTGDSVSMISECASTKKPLYIFDQKKISTTKHQNFHQNLFSENCAKKISANINLLENFIPKKLEETKRVASIIKSKLK